MKRKAKYHQATVKTLRLLFSRHCFVLRFCRAAVTFPKGRCGLRTSLGVPPIWTSRFERAFSQPAEIFSNLDPTSSRVTYSGISVRSMLLHWKLYS
ncbi:hypothetical protein AFLA_011085 [Aspergillus flavus NRRL3357]|nr:hypothetical protein AFLA_011085 [Aspergillus flavus NRRL3357]